MDDLTSAEKVMYIVLIVLIIFVSGVQIGIIQGKELERQEFYEYTAAN